MRVLLLSNSCLPVLGGLQTVVYTLTRKLQQREHKVQVVANHYPRSLPTKEIVDGVPINRWLFLTPKINDLRRKRIDLFLASLLFYPLTLLRLNHLYQSFRPDIINVHFPDSQIPHILWLQKRYPFRLIVSLHGHEILRWFEKNGYRQVNQIQTILQQADAVTACSQYLLNKAIELEPAVADKGHVIYNGIELERFTDKTPFPHDQPYIFAFGRLTHHKGFDMLLTAFSKISNHYPQWSLILAGDGDERTALQLQAKKLNLKKQVQFFGRATQTEIVALLNGCNLAVIPSRQETFGITVLEAMAAGKPILATNVGGLPELVKGKANRLVEPTVEGLSNGLLGMIENNNELNTLGEQNRAIATEYSLDTMADQYLSIYQNYKIKVDQDN